MANPTPKLTLKRSAILANAAAHNLGIVERPYLTGFERVSWDRNALYLVEAGLLRPYVHGGFEITESGRRALQDMGGGE